MGEKFAIRKDEIAVGKGFETHLKKVENELWVAEEGPEEAEDEAVVALGGGPRLDVSQKMKWERGPGIWEEGVGLL